METGLGDPETNKARYLLQQLEEETNPQLKRVIQKQINELTIGTLDRIITNNVLQTLTLGTNKLETEYMMILMIILPKLFHNLMII